MWYRYRKISVVWFLKFSGSIPILKWRTLNCNIKIKSSFSKVFYQRPVFSCPHSGDIFGIANISSLTNTPCNSTSLLPIPSVANLQITPRHCKIKTKSVLIRYGNKNSNNLLQSIIYGAKRYSESDIAYDDTWLFEDC